MKVYWQARKVGQRLVLLEDDESEIEVGLVRKTPRGFDALAKTNTYDPGRSQKGLATIEEAKTFVESFHPWEIFGGDWDLEVEPEVHGLSAEVPTPDEGESSQQTASAPEAAADGPEVATEEDVTPKKRGWQVWKKD